MLKMTHPQAIQDVDEFVFFIATDLEKFSIIASGQNASHNP